MAGGKGTVDFGAAEVAQPVREGRRSHRFDPQTCGGVGDSRGDNEETVFRGLVQSSYSNLAELRKRVLSLVALQV